MAPETHFLWAQSAPRLTQPAIWRCLKEKRTLLLANSFLFFKTRPLSLSGSPLTTKYLLMDRLTRQHATQSFEKDSATIVGKAELLQNCDLPHRVRLYSPTAYNDSKPTCPLNRYGSESRQNQSLLRALQLSQTRAREAERKTTEANVGKEQITALLLEDSLRLHAARQWVRLLEMEILLLRRRSDGEEARDEAASTVFTWCLSFALCLGIAGAGYMSCSSKCRS